MSQRFSFFVAGGCFLGLSLAIACGSDGEDSKFGDGSSGGASSGATSSGGSLLGSSGAGGEGGAFGEGGIPGNCNAPVDMFIMLDRSGSMAPDDNDDGNIGDTSTKWERSITALSGYFNSAGSKDQGAALQFFPLDSQNNSLCSTGDGYHVAAAPTAAPNFLTLPSNGFDKLLNDERPADDGAGLGTPTEAAIRGMIRFTNANRRPGRVTIGILITDGNPNNCNEDRDELADMLKAHYDQTQLRTYVIGMEGASFDNVERIAQGGGTPEHPDTVGALNNACGGDTAPCRHWNVGDGNPAAFEAALKAIQESADGCKPGGGVINPVK
jgi:hypothetical protein